ncbi:putative reverse transcriptase domain-containing protein [Tanacetum coccineum]
MITPTDQEPAQEIKHIWWDVCNCESCLDETAKIDDDDEDLPKKRKSSQQKLKRRYEKGDPTVGLLGEPSGKFDYYVLYPKEEPKYEQEFPALTAFEHLDSHTKHDWKIKNPTTIGPTRQANTISPAEATLNWQSENAVAQNKVLVKILLQQVMPSYTHPFILSDYDVEDAFSSINAPNYISTPSGYSLVTPENISPDSSDDLTKDLLSSLSISPFHDDPYMKMTPKRTSTSVAPTMTQDAIWQLVADSVATTLEAQAANMNRRQETIRTYAATPTKNKRYTKKYHGNLPLCIRCTLHHTGVCTGKCRTCNKVGHRTRNCRSKGPAMGSKLQSVFVTCHAYGEKGHYKSQCSKTDNSTFHVSKKSLCDESLVIPMKEIWLDDKLNYVDELVEIMDREVKQLRQRCIPIIKVKWNSEFTWEREDQIHAKYPHLFSNNTLSLN